MCIASLYAQCERNIRALEVAQSYSVSLRALLGKDPSRPNFCSIAGGAIVHGGIGSPGSPYLILWLSHILIAKGSENNFESKMTTSRDVSVSVWGVCGGVRLLKITVTFVIFVSK